MPTRIASVISDSLLNTPEKWDYIESPDGGVACIACGDFHIEKAYSLFFGISLKANGFTYYFTGADEDFIKESIWCWRKKKAEILADKLADLWELQGGLV